MNVICEKPYQYLLVESEGEYFLTFFTGGPVEIDICVRLTDSEIKEVDENNGNVEKLVKLFKNNRSSFEGRRVIPSVLPEN